MKTFKILALAALGLGAAAIVTPAEARDKHHGHGRHYRSWDGHRHGRVVVYSSPRYYSAPRYYTRSYARPYYYDDYYGSPRYSYSRPYAYYRPYSYSRGPSVSIAFGGSRYHHYRR